jgi:enoyl-CoA hydratase/carnithine racemase
MSTCTIQTDESGIALLTLDKPPMNALSTEVLKDLQKAVGTIQADDRVRVVIVTGGGEKAFVAGADIHEISGLEDRDEALNFVRLGQDIFDLIESSDKPFIAAINGFCLGGGLELALACHMRVADKKAKLGLPETKLGIIPGFGGTQRLSRAVGTALAYEIILSAGFISAEEALRIGLVNRLAETGGAVETAMEMALPMAGKGRPAVKAAMESIREGSRASFQEGIILERDRFVSICGTDNMKEGVAAFLEKREPVPKDS